jgi:beta-alanine--pyruvate transaminase
LVQLHDASTIAAVIVEPIAGSTGVLLPPMGYLQRLREHCTAHGILLIFDEVITGFGRTGAAFAAQRFGVTPDLITCAKGLSNGAVPMGAVLASRQVHDAFMQGPPEAIELFHGYTYSAHPLACAAALASLAVYADEGLFERAAALDTVFGQAVHGLRGSPHVVDVRQFGLVAGIELAPKPEAPGSRAFAVFKDCWEQGVLVRPAGDTLALSPPLLVNEGEVERIASAIKTALGRVA